MNKTLQLHRGVFSIEVTAPAGAGEYEIVAITAGTGNGWKFTPAVLQSSAPLWEGGVLLCGSCLRFALDP